MRREITRKLDGLSAVGLLVIVFLGATSCTTNVAFRDEKRIKIISPAARSTVTLPFDLRWTVTDFKVTGPDGRRDKNAGYFAIFVDRGTMPPGQDLSWIAQDDELCLKNPGCPDEPYLNQRYVYTTKETVFTFTSIIDTRPHERPEANDHHAVSIVLLNGAGQRIGETAFAVKFIVAR